MSTQSKQRSRIARTGKSGLFRVLGPPAIEAAQTIPLKNQKAALLVTYLAVQGTASRERLTGLLWPDLPQAKASANLRGVIHKLKSMAPESLEAEGDQLRLSENWDVDLKLLNEAVEHKERRTASGFLGIVCEGVSVPECEEMEQWLAQVREDTQYQMVINLIELSGQWQRLGHPDEAVDTARAAVGCDRLSEPAHAQLIRVLIDSGDRSAALRQYRILETVLLEELGVEPGPEIRELLNSTPEKTAVLHNLPASLTSFLGREQELSAVRSALQEHRLVTVTGMGGVGKTQLCVKIAHQILTESTPERGVWLVRLAPVLDKRFLKTAFEQSVALRTRGDDLSETLAGGSVLLVVDNCERLLDECGPYLKQLLENCPLLRVLATSREPLKVPGECVFRLEPFPVPDGFIDLDALAKSPAASLLLERGRMADPSLSLNEENAEAVLEICRELDGIPLALELAGARLGMLSPQQLVPQMRDRFQLLKGRPGDEARQQTLSALLDWSYQTLDEPLKELLASLSVFVGTFDLTAVEDVCLPGESQWEALERLTMLVEKSLVSTVNWGPVRRYRLLETVKRYSRDYLGEEDKDRLWDAHLAYYLKLARKAEAGLGGQEQRRWLKRLDAEVSNMQAAVRRARGRLHRLEGALELCLAPRLYWIIRDYRSVLRETLPPLLEEALEIGVRPELIIRSYRLLGELATDQGDLKPAYDYLDGALGLASRTGNEGERAHALKALGNRRYCQADFEQARDYYRQAEAVYKVLGDDAGKNDCHNNLGLVAFELGEFDTAFELFQSSLSLSQELADERSTALSYTNLGHLHLARADYPAAEQCLGKAFSIYRRLEDFGHPTLQTVKGMAQLALENGNLEKASVSLALAEQIARRTRMPDICSRRASLQELKERISPKRPELRSFKELLDALGAYLPE